MAAFVTAWLAFTWDMIARSALFLLIGFFLAGIIRALLTPEAITRVFGQGWFSQIYLSSLFGIPLPLCSCSVLPVAAQLHRSGLSPGGTVSFLISTPETGIDSIALSYKLLGPVFAAVRPVAALITALLGGTAVRLFMHAPRRQPVSTISVSENPTPRSFWGKMKKGLLYVIGDMFPELAYYLFWGYLLAGLAAALVPGRMPAGDLSGLWQYIGVIMVSLPVYVCATSSTPLAAVMLSLGILPGAVLIFLLVGPATNLTSLVVQKKILGLRGTIIMTISVVIAAVGCGLWLDAIMGGRFVPIPGIGESKTEQAAWYDIIAAALLTFSMAYFTLRHYYRKMKKKISGSGDA